MSNLILLILAAIALIGCGTSNAKTDHNRETGRAESGYPANR